MTRREGYDTVAGLVDIRDVVIRAWSGRSHVRAQSADRTANGRSSVEFYDESMI